MDIKEESQYIRPEMEIVSVCVGTPLLESPEQPGEDDPGSWDN